MVVCLYKGEILNNIQGSERFLKRIKNNRLNFFTLIHLQVLLHSNQIWGFYVAWTFHTVWQAVSKLSSLVIYSEVKTKARWVGRVEKPAPHLRVETLCPALVESPGGSLAPVCRQLYCQSLKGSRIHTYSKNPTVSRMRNVVLKCKLESGGLSWMWRKKG